MKLRTIFWDIQNENGNYILRWIILGHESLGEKEGRVNLLEISKTINWKEIEPFRSIVSKELELQNFMNQRAPLLSLSNSLFKVSNFLTFLSKIV